MTRAALAHALETCPPRIALMIEALLQAQADIEQHPLGTAELHFAHEQVKITLKISLGCYKFSPHQAL